MNFRLTEEQLAAHKKRIGEARMVSGRVGSIFNRKAKTFPCPHCEALFLSDRKLVRHVEAEHPRFLKSPSDALQDMEMARYTKTRQKPRKSNPSKPSKALKAVPTEHEEQVAVIQWWSGYAAAHNIPECLLFAIPNGANKSMATAAKFKREGLRAGIPDLFLAMVSYAPRQKTPYGLFIEMKRKGWKYPRTSKNVHYAKQVEMRDMLYKQGYEVKLCAGAEQAIEAIKTYLGE